MITNLYGQEGKMMDPRDGKEYKTVQIGAQIWMAQNLAYDSPNIQSDCYKDSASNCEKYGRLYMWEVANVCPSGWHLPSKEEVESLLKSIDGDIHHAYTALRIGGSSGLGVLLGGYYFYSDPPPFSAPTGHSLVEGVGVLWTSTEGGHPSVIKSSKNQIKTWAHTLALSAKKKRAVIGYLRKKSAISVRYIKD